MYVPDAPPCLSAAATTPRGFWSLPPPPPAASADTDTQVLMMATLCHSSGGAGEYVQEKLEAASELALELLPRRPSSSAESAVSASLAALPSPPAPAPAVPPLAIAGRASDECVAALAASMTMRTRRSLFPGSTSAEAQAPARLDTPASDYGCGVRREGQAGWILVGWKWNGGCDERELVTSEKERGV